MHLQKMSSLMNNVYLQNVYLPIFSFVMVSFSWGRKITESRGRNCSQASQACPTGNADFCSCCGPPRCHSFNCKLQNRNVRTHSLDSLLCYPQNLSQLMTCSIWWGVGEEVNKKYFLLYLLVDFPISWLSYSFCCITHVYLFTSVSGPDLCSWHSVSHVHPTYSPFVIYGTHCTPISLCS